MTAHTTCFVGPRNAKGEKTWTDCSNSTDTLKIEQNPDTNTQRELPAIVSIDLAFTNGHACSFKGVAGWSVDRLTAYSGEQPNCQIIMFFFARAAHLVATKECSAHCGARGSLDGVVLKKQSGL